MSMQGNAAVEVYCTKLQKEEGECRRKMYTPEQTLQHLMAIIEKDKQAAEAGWY